MMHNRSLSEKNLHMSDYGEIMVITKYQILNNLEIHTQETFTNFFLQAWNETKLKTPT